MGCYCDCLIKMKIICNKQKQVFVMVLHGRMDRISAMEFDKSFSEWLKNGERFFVVDMQGLEYISSAGLHSLLSANQQLKDNNGQIHLCNVSGLVREVFTISGFESLFTVHSSLAEAVKFK